VNDARVSTVELGKTRGKAWTAQRALLPHRAHPTAGGLPIRSL